MISDFFRKLKDKKDSTNIKIREYFNPYYGKYRRKKLKRTDFTIISNNCWAGHVYRYYDLPYNTPTVGMYIFSEDYLKFVYNLRRYIDTELSFINLDQSRFKDILKERGGKNVICPIGKLDDIEIIFLHSTSQEEAYEKWNRRKQRINWDNLYFKMSEQNLCTKGLLAQFEKLSYPKAIFTHADYGFKSQFFYKEFSKDKEVVNDTTHFRRYINITKWLNKE